MSIIKQYINVREGIESGDEAFAVRDRVYKIGVLGIWTIYNGLQEYIIESLTEAPSPIPRIRFPTIFNPEGLAGKDLSALFFSSTESSGPIVPVNTVFPTDGFTPGEYPSGLAWQVLQFPLSTASITGTRLALGIKDGDVIRLDRVGGSTTEFVVGEVITGSYVKAAANGLLDSSGDMTYFQGTGIYDTAVDTSTVWTASNLASTSSVDTSAIDGEIVTNIFTFAGSTVGGVNIGYVYGGNSSIGDGSGLVAGEIQESGHKGGAEQPMWNIWRMDDGSIKSVWPGINIAYDGLTVSYLMPYNNDLYDVVLPDGTFFMNGLTVETMHIYVEMTFAYFTATNGNKYFCITTSYTGFTSDYITQVDPDLLFGEDIVEVFTEYLRLIFVTESGRFWTHTGSDSKELIEIFIDWGEVSSSKGTWQHYEGMDLSAGYLFIDEDGNKIYTAPTRIKAKRNLSGIVDFGGSLIVIDDEVYGSGIAEIQQIDGSVIEYFNTNGLSITNP